MGKTTERWPSPHLRLSLNIRGEDNSRPRSLGAVWHQPTEGFRPAGDPVAVGAVRAGSWGSEHLDLLSGDLAWWDALIGAATATRNQLRVLHTQASTNTESERVSP
jgi:hypothetical protein